MYVCVYAYVHTCLVPKEPEEGTRSSRSGVTDDSGPPCGCWEMNLGFPLLLLGNSFCPHRSFCVHMRIMRTAYMRPSAAPPTPPRAPQLIICTETFQLVDTGLPLFYRWLHDIPWLNIEGKVSCSPCLKMERLRLGTGLSFPALV